MRAAERKPQSGLSRHADRRTLPASATSTASLSKPIYDASSSRTQRPPNYDARVTQRGKPHRGSSEKFSPIVPWCRARNSATALGFKCRQQRRPRQAYQFWDFDNYLAETDDQDEIQAVYTNEPQQYGNLISQYRKGPTIWTPSYHHYDALGSTRALTDEGGDATDTYVYDAWGNEVAVSGSTVNPFRWVGDVGYYWDDETGTFYIRARVYEPITGRWMSQDPLYYPIANEFATVFAHGRLDPVGGLDASGLKGVGPAWGIVNFVQNRARFTHINISDADFATEVSSHATPRWRPGWTTELFHVFESCVVCSCCGNEGPLIRYNAVTRQFISRDPVGIAGSDTNLYGHVGDDPMNKADASGLDWEDWRCVNGIALIDFLHIGFGNCAAQTGATMGEGCHFVFHDVWVGKDPDRELEWVKCQRKLNKRYRKNCDKLFGRGSH